MFTGTEKLIIGKYIFPNRLLLAPMVDVTDLPYRLVCKKAGAGYASTEMLYIDAITHENPATQKLMETAKSERPTIIQVTGNNLAEFKRALPYLKKYDIVDINCGCPSTRIIGSKAGSFLLKSPEKIASIIRLLVSNKITVTAKIRLGYDNHNVLDVAKLIEQAGASALTIHCRLAVHSNKTPADWSWIGKVKASVTIPVIGNGDIDSPEKVHAMLQIADGAMLARSAIGDPDIFARSLIYLKTNKKREKSFARNLPYLKLYLKYCKKYKCTNVHRIRYVVGSFFSGFAGASAYRTRLQTCKTVEEIQKLVSSFSTTKRRSS